MSRYQVRYEVKGMRMMEYIIPDFIQLPDDWDTYGVEDKDEWFFNNKTNSCLKYEDLYDIEPIGIDEIP